LKARREPIGGVLPGAAEARPGRIGRRLLLQIAAKSLNAAAGLQRRGGNTENCQITNRDFSPWRLTRSYR